MKHAVIVAHPSAASFTLSMARAYSEAAGALGHDVILRDLYRMNFAPCLEASEITRGAEPGPDVASERSLLADVDVFAFVYPFWMNSQPAMMKGYIDRVFGRGFAYGPVEGGIGPMLVSRKMISFTACGSAPDWVPHAPEFQAARALFDRHFAAVSGMEIVDHVHFDGVGPGLHPDVAASHLAKVRETVRRFPKGR